MGYIPIPRIEYTDDSLDLVVENLTLEGRKLFPNIIGVESHNHFRFSPYGAIVRDIKHGRKAHDEETHRVRITLEQMQADMRDVRFVYRKKTGVVRICDEGVADVILGGSGLTVSVFCPWYAYIHELTLYPIRRSLSISRLRHLRHHSSLRPR